MIVIKCATFCTICLVKMAYPWCIKYFAFYFLHGIIGISLVVSKIFLFIFCIHVNYWQYWRYSFSKYCITFLAWYWWHFILVLSKIFLFKLSHNIFCILLVASWKNISFKVLHNISCMLLVTFHLYRQRYFFSKYCKIFLAYYLWHFIGIMEEYFFQSIA